ncbi:MAG: ABC transporter substrate-binding protein [Coriobacteriales bacterium]|nr:ABC transporter substrate-binding protein [Coriobacteriales bacterium]
MPHSGRRAWALCLALALATALALGACAGGAAASGDAAPGASQAQTSHTTLVDDFGNPDLGCGWEPAGQLELSHAKRFCVYEYAGGYRLACLADGARYLVVPKGATVPEDLAKDVVVIQQPLGDVYLAASDSLCLFQALGMLDRVTVSGIERDDWQIPAAREAMDAGAMVYGGKYRAPDYELLVDRGVRLAMESSMINHVPEVREKLVELGIPVLTELSSYEDEPLGRAEWIKLVGVLCDCEDEAKRLFQEQVDQAAGVGHVDSGKTVAFFYLNANGAAVVRRPGDYVTKMIEQAGGTYAFDELEPATPGASSVTLEAERFFQIAKDADVMVYNATIDDGVDTLDDLLRKNELLATCKAVRQGEVWVTDKSMYQQMLESGEMIADFNRALRGEGDDLAYLRRLV